MLGAMGLPGVGFAGEQVAAGPAWLRPGLRDSRLRRQGLQSSEARRAAARGVRGRPMPSLRRSKHMGTIRSCMIARSSRSGPTTTVAGAEDSVPSAGAPAQASGRGGGSRCRWRGALHLFICWAAPHAQTAHGYTLLQLGKRRWLLGAGRRSSASSRASMYIGRGLNSPS
jgi:hypothetical protein